MLDIKLIRENPNMVRTGLKNRGGKSVSDFEKVLATDRVWREVVVKLDELRAKRNKAADDVGQLKRENKDASSIINEMEGLKKDLKDQEEKERALKMQIDDFVLRLPNLPDPSVPIGKSPDDNKEVRSHGDKPTFSFQPKDHHTLGTDLGILEIDIATKMSGSRFTMLAKSGSRLERALANFMLDLHTKEHGYVEYTPPTLVATPTITNTGQLPRFEDELYKCKDDDLYLIPTAEVSLANLYRDSLVDEKDLPFAVTAYTPCYRREAGSYGKDTRGLIRNHQFTKVELVRFCKLEDSLSELEKLTGHAEEVLKQLEIPYRVLELCTFDLGFASAKTYDLEVWMPGENQWREISSCSTCSDFQARRMNFKIKKDKGKMLGCTLNGSGIAVGRTVAALLENGQQKDGGIRIPKALIPYFGEDKIIKR